MKIKKEIKHASTSLLKELVNVSSYTFDSVGVNKCGAIVKDFLINNFPENKVHIKILKSSIKSNKGNSMICNMGSTRKPNLLLSGHLDTVHKNHYSNFSEKDVKFYGPGINDMKGGIVVLLFGLLEYYKKTKTVPHCTLVFTPDEEDGSKEFSSELGKIYKNHKIGLVFEGGGLNNEICYQRKGVCQFRLTVKGKAGHAGYFVNKYPNAIEEMAYKILEIRILSSLYKDTSVNIGKIDGGLRPNIIADKCTIEIDCRFTYLKELNRIRSLLKHITSKSRIKGSKANLEETAYLPPMVPAKNGLILLKEIKKLANDMEFPIILEKRGGGSDGNFMADRGMVVIDGLGACGAEAHTRNEYIIKDFLWKRILLCQKIIEMAVNYNF